MGVFLSVRAVKRSWARLAAAPWALLGLAALFSSCEAVVNVDPLTNGRCPPNTKVCEVDGALTCVSTSNPDFGCSNPSCAPCALPNAIADCSENASCTRVTCLGSYINCDSAPNPAAGCTIDRDVDDQNCGVCGSKCQTTIVHGKAYCQFGVCEAEACDPGFKPLGPACVPRVGADAGPDASDDEGG
jgi:hypothetical protein